MDLFVTSNGFFVHSSSTWIFHFDLLDKMDFPDAKMVFQQRVDSSDTNMVFSDKKMASSYHNRLNLRDTSSEPQNIYGD